VLSIALNNDRQELLRLAESVEKFGAEHHLSDDLINNVNLVLDEMVSNVIKYGRAPADPGDIKVTLSVDDTRLTIDISDGGIAFNPLEARPPDLDLPVMERPIGGLGIHIVKTLTETSEYRRERDRNHVTFTMLL
jgi:anti-sigma regulatory factor (Ser/Thr protein kinase)